MTVKYTIGKISILIKRHVTTIRRWESRGWIPKAERGAAKQDRYWSREQLEMIKKFAEMA